MIALWGLVVSVWCAVVTGWFTMCPAQQEGQHRQRRQHTQTVVGLGGYEWAPEPSGCCPSSSQA